MDIEIHRINNFVLLKKKAIKVTIIDTGLLQLDDQDVARHIKVLTVCNAEEHPRGAPLSSTLCLVYRTTPTHLSYKHWKVKKVKNVSLIISFLIPSQISFLTYPFSSVSL